MFLHTFQPQPIIAHLGSLTIHWYGLFLSLGALAGYVVFVRLGKRYRLSGSELELLYFWTIVAGIVGARLYHVLNEWSVYAQRPSLIPQIWNGGLAIHGAMIAGFFVLLWFGIRRKISVWLLADIAVPALAIGQAIGRWGNYFNQELFGKPTALPWGIPIEPLNRPIQYLSIPYFHPTFFYESLGSLIVFGALLWLHRIQLQRRDRKKNNTPASRWFRIGTITIVYLFLESLIRVGTEFLRVDRVPTVFNLRLPLLVSAALAIAAVVLFFLQSRRSQPS